MCVSDRTIPFRFWGNQMLVHVSTSQALVVLFPDETNLIPAENSPLPPLPLHVILYIETRMEKGLISVIL